MKTCRQLLLFRNNRLFCLRFHLDVENNLKQTKHAIKKYATSLASTLEARKTQCLLPTCLSYRYKLGLETNY